MLGINEGASEKKRLKIYEWKFHYLIVNYMRNGSDRIGYDSNKKRLYNKKRLS